ncbi:MAG: sporulation protein YabP [Oscillospiraceae bacterium]|nr:sporulation protein YabP [Oscillospiraceae bacterium]
MAYEDKYRLAPEQPHSVVIDQRGKITATGVSDVESFDENEIVVSTSQGVMIVRGSNLHIGKLSLDTGDMSMEGTVDSIEYEDVGRSQGGFFSRMFR